MNYKTIFEEKYVKPGILIYREDFKQFLKIMPNQDYRANIYTFMASDENLDDPNEYFRIITYAFSSGSFLYSFFLSWKRSMVCASSYSLAPQEEGSNQLCIEEKEDKVFVHFIKDVRHSRNLQLNSMKLTVAGPYIASFSSLLKAKETEEEKAYVLQKMLSLQPKHK